MEEAKKKIVVCILWMKKISLRMVKRLKYPPFPVSGTAPEVGSSLQYCMSASVESTVPVFGMCSFDF